MFWLYKHKNYFTENWRISKGGGPLGINLVHDLDIICYLLGPITYVQAFTSNKIRKYKVEDTATVNLIFKSGALCTINISDTIVSPWSYELTAGENPVYPIKHKVAILKLLKPACILPNFSTILYKSSGVIGSFLFEPEPKVLIADSLTSLGKCFAVGSESPAILWAQLIP